MDWTDEGILLARRRLGEADAVVQVLTRGHGRHAGLVKGGSGRRLSGVLQPGNRLRLAWRARLADQLGSLAVESLDAKAAALYDDAGRLAALAAACAICETTLPEREPHPAVHDALAGLIAALCAGSGTAGWGGAYVRWELGLLADLGYGLDLSACAATGATADLAWVSPKTGRAVSRAGAAGWEERLLPLPAFLGGAAGPDSDDLAAVRDGLRLTGHFLRRQAVKALPAARLALGDRFDAISGGNAPTFPQGTA